MALSENAKQALARSISRAAYDLSFNFPENGLNKLIQAIERDLDEAGLVVVRQDDLDASGWISATDSRDSDS